MRRAAVQRAKAAREVSGKPTLLFLDEVHRFNKSQQDTFLPYLEDGTLIFVGATTENPSFEVVSALLSRARVYVLRSLTVDDISSLLRTALADEERGLGKYKVRIDPDAKRHLAKISDGDARKCLNALEIGVLTTATSGQGFILLDSRLRPVAYNSEAVQILSFPTRPESIKQLSQFLGDEHNGFLVG